MAVCPPTKLKNLNSKLLIGSRLHQCYGINLIPHFPNNVINARSQRDHSTIASLTVPLFKKIWRKVCRETSDIFGKELDLTPLTCILGLHPALNLNPCIFIQMFFFWCQTQWLQGILVLIPLEAVTYWLKDKHLLFN